MKTKAVLILVAVIAIAADDPKEAVKKELDKIQGSWTAESIHFNGKEYADGQGKIKLVFKGDQATVEAAAKVKKEYAKMTMKLDPSTDPKCIDITVTAGVQKDVVMEGIYELKGDELRICAKVFGKDRPGKFESTDGSSVVLIVFKRDKP
jgi:uncharacterized protein (TIGR03067 family)